MNSSGKFNKQSEKMIIGADEPTLSNGFQAQAKYEDQHEPDEDKEDVKFVSELGWLAAASITIASVAQAIGIS